ncbi:MAG TPA: hypothetical protein VI758_06390 [Bacteroidota bacterium]
MKKNILALVLPLVFCSTTAYSQDAVTLCGSHIAKAMLNDQSMREQLQGFLNSAYEVHPDLVFYNIAYFNLLALDSTGTHRWGLRELRAQINGMRSRYLYRRSLWAKRQIERMNAMQADDEVKSIAVEILDPIVVNPTVDPDTPDTLGTAGSNRKDYFSVFLLAEQPLMPFDSLVDYRQMRKTEETRIVDSAANLFGNNDAFASASTSAVLSLILRHWYLFGDVGSADEQLQHSTLACNMLLALANRDFSTAYQSRFSLSVGFIPFNTSLNATPLLPIAGYNISVHGATLYPDKQFSLSFGYKYHTKTLLKPLSYINIQCALSSNPGIFPSHNSPGYERHYTTPAGVVNDETLTFSRSIASPISISTMLKVSTPVFFFSKSIPLEVGIQSGFNQLTYNYDYSYHFQNYFVYGTLSFGVDKQSDQTAVKKYKFHNFIILPTVDIFVPVSAQYSADFCTSIGMVSLMVKRDL